MNKQYVSAVKKFLLTFLFLSWIYGNASADESIFAWTYTTDILPKGKFEVEHWTTARLKKEHGTYQAIDLREELEYGITDNLQASFYINHNYLKSKNSLPEEDPLNPGHRLAGSFEPEDTFK